jgi:hypothetical protein
MQRKEHTIYFLGIFLALGFLSPDQFLPWPAFRHDVVIGIAFLPFICQLLGKTIKIPREGFFLLFLSAIPLLQMVTGEIIFSGDGWLSWLYLSAAALTMIAGFNCFNSSPAKNPLQGLLPVVTALLSTAVVSVCISLVQWLNLELLPELILSIPSDARPSANLAQPNQLATLLLIGLACVSFLFECRKLVAWSAVLLSMFLLFGIAMTQSRTAFLALIFVGVSYWGLRQRAKLTTTSGSILFLAAFFILAILLLPWFNEMLLLKKPVSMVERTTKDVRVHLWISMMDAIARAPWSGYGWGQIPAAQQAVALDHPATYAYFDSSHNIFLDVALWAGVPVALTCAAGLLFWFKLQIATCRDPLSWSMLLAVGVVFCHAMVEYPLAYAYILLPTSLFMGALSSKRFPLLDKKKSARVLSSSLFFALSATTLTAFVVISVEYIKFENNWRALRLTAAGLGPQVADSVGFKPFFLTQLSAYADFYQLEPDRGLSERQIGQMGQVAQRFGQQSIFIRYAVATALNGRPEESARSLAMLCKTQRPRVCKQAIDNWRAISRDSAYPELKQVVLPAG